MGITCQPRLHINTIVAKASQRANAILRCFQSRDPCVLLRAFKVYVRPILEYNTTVWSPSQKKALRPSKRYNVGLRRDSLDSEIIHIRNGFGS